MVGAILREFLDSAMQKAHDHRRLGNALTFESENDLEHTMCRRMLRPHVKQQLFTPQNRKILGLRMLRIDFINRLALIF